MIGFEITVLVLACLGLVSIAALGFAMKSVVQQIVNLWEDSTNRLESRVQGTSDYVWERISSQFSHGNESNYQAIKQNREKLNFVVEEVDFLKQDLKQLSDHLTSIQLKSGLTLTADLATILARLDDLEEQLKVVPEKITDPVVNVNIDGTAIKGTVKVKEMPEKKGKTGSSKSWPD